MAPATGAVIGSIAYRSDYEAGIAVIVSKLARVDPHRG